MKLKRRGVELRFILETREAATRALDAALLKALAWGHRGSKN